MELELNSQDWNVNANELELELKDMKRTLELLDESKSMVTLPKSAIFYYPLLSNHLDNLYSTYNKMIRIQAACKHINNAFMLVDVRDFSALLPSNHVENCCAVLLLILLQRGFFIFSLLTYNKIFSNLYSSFS